MRIVYVSLTGNVRNFVGRLDMDSTELNHTNPLTKIGEEFILISPTYNNELTDAISEFIDYEDNINHLIGFVGSGNRNFDNMYCFNAKDLSKKYNKPLLFTFEFSGTDNDIIEFKKEVYKVGSTKTTRKN